MSRRSVVVRSVAIAALFGLVVLLIGELVPGAQPRLENASPAWLALAVALEVGACAGYAVLFHAVFSRSPQTVGWWRSARIALGELAGFALVPAGLGGPALRFWALRRSGMPLRTVAVRSVSHAPVFNAPYLAAALVLGIAVAVGVGP